MDGYSWSGAEKPGEALTRSGNSSATWSWQLLGQWLITSSQSKAEAGSVCWASVALPEKSMTSSTAQVVLAVGALICATGGVLFAWIVTESVSEAPSGSVTLTDATWLPAW